MKKAFAIFLAVAMVLSISACAATPAPAVPQPQQPGQAAAQPEAVAGETELEPVTIRFANYALLEEGYTEFWEGVRAGFEAKHPHITIEWVTAPYGEIVTQVINMAGAGDRVDLMWGEIDWTPVFQDVGLAIPVENVLTQEFLADFYPSVLDAARVNGVIYSLPLKVSPFVMWYNRDILAQAGFDAPPRTFNEMLEMGEVISQMLTEDGNTIYTFGQATASRPVTGASLTGLIYNFGGQLLDEQGNLSIDNPGFTEAFEMLQLLDELGYNPQNALLRDLRNLFALGRLAMYYDQSWGFNGINAINPYAREFANVAAPMAGGSGQGYSILQGKVLIFMDNGPERREATRLLAEYMMTWEVIGDYITNMVPAFPSVRTMDGMVSPMLAGAAHSIEMTTPITFVPTLTDLFLELCAMAQMVTVGGMDVDAAKEAFRNAAQMILN